VVVVVALIDRSQLPFSHFCNVCLAQSVHVCASLGKAWLCVCVHHWAKPGCVCARITGQSLAVCARITGQSLAVCAYHWAKPGCVRASLGKACLCVRASLGKALIVHLCQPLQTREINSIIQQLTMTHLKGLDSVLPACLWIS